MLNNRFESSAPAWLSITKPAYLFVLLIFIGIIFVAAPIAAMVPVALFAYMYVRKECFACMLATLVWIGYGMLEYGMYTRTLCSGECNIRIDLIISWAILAKFSSKAINDYFANRHA